MSLTCARCNQPIEPGHLYQYVIRAEPDVGSFEVIRGNLPVHDYPCPTRMAIVGGRVVLDDGDIGSEEFVVVPMMVEMPLVSKPTDGNAE